MYSYDKVIHWLWKGNKPRAEREFQEIKRKVSKFISTISFTIKLDGENNMAGVQRLRIFHTAVKEAVTWEEHYYSWTSMRTFTTTKNRCHCFYLLWVSWHSLCNAWKKDFVSLKKERKHQCDQKRLVFRNWERCIECLWRDFQITKLVSRHLLNWTLSICFSRS